MNDIDTIMDMLNWHQPEDIQAEGRKIAQNVKCISVFVMPINGKCVWDNCAMILSEKNDDELKHILPNLLFWERGTLPSACPDRLERFGGQYQGCRCNIYLR